MKVNTLIIGQPGIGKTVAVKSFVADDMKTSDKNVLIIDSNSEYLQVANALGGKVHDLSIKDNLILVDNRLVVFPTESFEYRNVNLEVDPSELKEYLMNVVDFVIMNGINKVYISSDNFYRELLHCHDEYKDFISEIELVAIVNYVSPDNVNLVKTVFDKIVAFKSSTDLSTFGLDNDVVSTLRRGQFATTETTYLSEIQIVDEDNLIFLQKTQSI